MRLIAAVVALSLGACVYSRGAIGHNAAGYTNYPATLADEHARRSKRRRHALIAAPIELVGGTAITALALFAPSSPEPGTDDSVTAGLAAAGKELVGRLVLASVGGAIALGGVGDAVLGATDPLFASPVVRDGELIDADHIDLLPPPRAPRLDVHSSQELSLQGWRSGLGVGVAHWISDTLRMREAVTGELGQGFGPLAVRGFVTGEVELERAFRRERLGLYPRTALGIYGGGGYSWAARHDAPLVRGGISFTRHLVQYRLGVSQLVDVRRPTIELAFRYVLPAD
ncbi:MAG: hypothetical protein K8W52_13455 [Deltaproteobacteria bacterium]|nr:hypothetical protein [Deltaproteobacteria bacterium]